MPPAPPEGAGPGDGPGETVFAVSKIFVGDETRDGVPDPNAWKTFGFDLDGYTTTATFSQHCKPQEGGKKKDIAVDGEGGIDNSFGKNIVGSVLSGLVANPTDEVNLLLRKGESGWVLRVQELGAGGAYDPLSATWHLARSPLPGEPPATVEPGRTWSPLSSPEATSLGGYLTGHALVLRAPRLRMDLFLSGLPWPIEVHQATLYAQFSEGHAAGTRGTIAGLLPAESFIEQFRPVAPWISSSFCDGGPAFDEIAQQIRRAADSLMGGGQDPEKTCDAISIGLGFDLVTAQLGASVEPALPADPCAATGGGGAGGAGPGGADAGGG